jgi:hypothetical protein
MTRPFRFLVLLAMGAAATCHASDKKIIDRILGTWAATQGGIGAQPLVTSYGIQESMSIRGSAATSVKVRVVRTRASHFRIEFTPDGADTIVFGFDGEILWQARPLLGFGLLRPLRDDPFMWENSLFIALELVPPNASHYTKDPEQVDGADCVVAAVEWTAGSYEACYFDRKTSRLVRVVRPPLRGVAGSRRTTIDIGDYRPVGALSIPFLVSVNDGISSTTYHRSDVTINQPVDEGSFVLSTSQVQEAGVVDQILSRQSATIGNREAFAKVHTRVTHMSVQSPTTGVHYTQTVSLKAPNLVLVETQTPGVGLETRGFDGKNGWFSSDIEGNRPLKPPEVSQLIYLTNINQLGQLAATCPYRRLLGRRLVNGRTVDAVALAAPKGPPATFYFDKESGRLIRIATSTVIPGEEFESTIDFADFRVVDGVEVPFQITSETPVMKTVSTVVSVENNVRLDDSIFHERRSE